MNEKRFDPFGDVGMEEEDLAMEETVPAGAADLFGGDEKKVTAPVKAEPAAKKVEIASEDVLGDLEDMAGNIVIGEIGKINTSPFPIQRMKFSKEAKSLISVVSAKSIASFGTHFLEGPKFNIVCFKGRCCDELGSPKRRIVLPIVVYTTDSNGRPISKDLSFAALSLSKEYYENIETFNSLRAPGDVSDMDILVSCSDEKYQKLTFFDNGAAKWKKDPETVKKVREFWKKNFKYIVPVVAKPVTEADYLRIMGKEPAPLPSVPDATSKDTLDIFG